METNKPHISKEPSHSIVHAPSASPSGNISIATSFRQCLESFEKLVANLEESHLAFTQGTPFSMWEDELGRLKVWAGNIGAHLEGQASLDFRLRDASHIRQNIADLIQDLQQTIRDIRDSLTDPEQPGHDVAPESSANDREPESELQQLHREVVNIIGCLFQMSMLVRNPAKHSLLTEIQPSDMSAYESFDRNHVKDKYPKAREDLVRNLGIAQTRRRKQLKYRERHHAKLSKGLDGSLAKPSGNDNLGVLSNTIATEFKLEDLTLEDRTSKSELSSTSYASSLFDGGNIRVPRPPSDSIGGKPFECSYCYYVITIADTRSWIKHVFRDLQPYSCVVMDCPIPYKIYSTRREWSHHLWTTHSRTWLGTDYRPSGHGRLSEAPQICAICPLCKMNFDSENQFERHLARHFQELALFVIPRDEVDSDDDVIDNGLGDLKEISNSSGSDSQQENDVTSGKISYKTAKELSLASEEGDGVPDVREKRRDRETLIEFFVVGKGIRREVLQREICNYLGPEAYSVPSTYNVCDQQLLKVGIFD